MNGTALLADVERIPLPTRTTGDMVVMDNPPPYEIPRRPPHHLPREPDTSVLMHLSVDWLSCSDSLVEHHIHSGQVGHG
ncbi:hypothetical protein [Azospirillum griseum]|uniref:Uncharacterized protein n=2 Tax=Azospirillum griseum TaxID=2496639 RepID=A0A431VKH8_9PROT|nr:hypothetical protein [Azospirillum griseum]RTR22529.1 hypothetical protein EJ903_06855 [Azospirillum griseum]